MASVATVITLTLYFSYNVKCTLLGHYCDVVALSYCCCNCVLCVEVKCEGTSTTTLLQEQQQHQQHKRREEQFLSNSKS